MRLSSSVGQKEIIDQLNRILSYPVFRNSMILSGFLRYIVEETLEGRQKYLKEYTVGTHVLLKKEGYNPQTDASVRIHAGRLRKALQEYYGGPGANDPIRISMPKGAYVPKFGEVSASPHQVTQSLREAIFKPTLAILPFQCFGERDLLIIADGLCDQICTEFINFNEISVVSYYASRTIAAQGMDLKEAGLSLDATYLLTGSLQADEDVVRVRVQLNESLKNRQVWACSYEKQKSAMGNFTIQDDIVRHVINQIGGSHGIIFREAAKASYMKSALDVKVYDAVFWYYHLLHDVNEDTFGKGLDVMRSTVQLDPQYALGWAILGETYVAGFFYGFECSVPHPLEEAVKCGQKALSIDARCQHAYQTLCLAYLFEHRWKDCLQIVDQWKALKTSSTGIAGGLGFCLICVGEYERGYTLLNESIQVNPYYPWWFNAGLSIYHFEKSEYDEAVYWAEKMQRQSIPWELILKGAAYAAMTNFGAARLCIQELDQILPHLSISLKPILHSFLKSEMLIDRLWKALRSVDL